MPTLDVAINARKAKQGSDQFDSAVRKVKRGAGTVDASVKKSDKALAGFGATAKKVALGLVTFAAAYKSLRFAISSVKEFAAFEMGLANVSTMLDDASMKYMPEYEKQLKKMAIEFGQSTGTLSKGLYDILSASVDADKAIKVLRVSSKAAIAGLTDTATAADALTTIINAYGMEAEDAAKISDILFATVKGGKITFGELAGSIGKVAAIGATAGLSFEEMSAAIATMTRSGIQADMAMTALKGIVTTFLSPQKEGIEVAKKFGLELNANTLQTLGLSGALEKLEHNLETGKRATAEETAAIFSNVRALLGVSATRKSLTALIQDYQNMLDSAGSTEEAYHKIADMTAMKLKRLNEWWKAIKVSSGSAIATMVLGAQDYTKAIEDMAASSNALLAIRAGMLPTKENQAFIQSLKDAKEATDRLNEANEKSRAIFDRQAKKRIKIAEIDADVEPIKKYTEEQKEAGLAVTALFNELKAERELIGLTTEERERAIKLIEFEAHAKELLGDKSGEMVELYKNELKNMQDLYIEAEKTAEFYKNIGEGMEGLIRSPLTALLDESRDIEDVLKDELRNLATSVLEMMYEEVITKPLMDAIKAGAQPALNALSNMISNFLSGIAGGVTKGIGGVIGGALMSVVGGGFGGLFGGGGGGIAAGTEAAFMTKAGARGLVLNNGSITPFEKGDILTRPTIFPMSNGGIGLAAEAGKPEAIMPLTRDKSGRLGVRAEGQQTSGTPIKIINVMDQSQVQEYLGSGDGERQIVNIMRRNANEIREVIG